MLAIEDCCTQVGMQRMMCYAVARAVDTGAGMKKAHPEKEKCMHMLGEAAGNEATWAH